MTGKQVKRQTRNLVENVSPQAQSKEPPEKKEPEKRQADPLVPESRLGRLNPIDGRGVPACSTDAERLRPDDVPQRKGEEEAYRLGKDGGGQPRSRIQDRLKPGQIGLVDDATLLELQDGRRHTLVGETISQEQERNREQETRVGRHVHQERKLDLGSPGVSFEK